MRRWAILILMLSLLLPLLGCGSTQESKIRKGATAPDFTLEDLDGAEVSLSDFEGRPILINFWASWCPPCRVEMPELERIYEDHEDEPDGLVIIAVNLLYQDDLEDVYDFVQTTGLRFPILLDQAGDVAVAYRVGSLPTSVFVDTRGRIHLIQVGPMTQRFVDSVLLDMP